MHTRLLLKLGLLLLEEIEIVGHLQGQQFVAFFGYPLNIFIYIFLCILIHRMEMLHGKGCQDIVKVDICCLAERFRELGCWFLHTTAPQNNSHGQIINPVNFLFLQNSVAFLF